MFDRRVDAGSNRVSYMAGGHEDHRTTRYSYSESEINNASLSLHPIGENDIRTSNIDPLLLADRSGVPISHGPRPSHVVNGQWNAYNVSHHGSGTTDSTSHNGTLLWTIPGSSTNPTSVSATFSAPAVLPIEPSETGTRKSNVSRKIRREQWDRVEPYIKENWENSSERKVREEFERVNPGFTFSHNELMKRIDAWNLQKKVSREERDSFREDPNSLDNDPGKKAKVAKSAKRHGKKDRQRPKPSDANNSATLPADTPGTLAGLDGGVHAANAQACNDAYAAQIQMQDDDPGAETEPIPGPAQAVFAQLKSVSEAGFDTGDQACQPGARSSSFGHSVPSIAQSPTVPRFGAKNDHFSVKPEQALLSYDFVRPDPEIESFSSLSDVHIDKEKAVRQQELDELAQYRRPYDFGFDGYPTDSRGLFRK